MTDDFSYDFDYSNIFESVGVFYVAIVHSFYNDLSINAENLEKHGKLTAPNLSSPVFDMLSGYQSVPLPPLIIHGNPRYDCSELILHKSM